MRGLICLLLASRRDFSVLHVFWRHRLNGAVEKTTPGSFFLPVHLPSTRSPAWYLHRPGIQVDSRWKRGLESFVPLGFATDNFSYSIQSSVRPSGAPRSAFLGPSRISCTARFSYYYCYCYYLGTPLPNLFYAWFTFAFKINIMRYCYTLVCHN